MWRAARTWGGRVWWGEKSGGRRDIARERKTRHTHTHTLTRLTHTLMQFTQILARIRPHTGGHTGTVLAHSRAIHLFVSLSSFDRNEMDPARVSRRRAPRPARSRYASLRRQDVAVNRAVPASRVDPNSRSTNSKVLLQFVTEATEIY